MPAKVVEGIEKYFRNFLWTGYRGNKLSHLMKWDILKKPLEAGGLETIDIKQKNRAILAKWVSCFDSEKGALWRILIKAKYGSCHLSTIETPVKSHYETEISYMRIFIATLAMLRPLPFGMIFGLVMAPLNKNIPRLYHLAIDKEASVDEVWDANICS